MQYWELLRWSSYCWAGEGGPARYSGALDECVDRCHVSGIRDASVEWPYHLGRTKYYTRQISKFSPPYNRLMAHVNKHIP